MPILEARNVSKSYSIDGRPITVLDDVSFTVAAGEFLVVRGVSGSGKSTLLTILSGLDRPDLGRIVMEGKDITELSEAELAKWRASNVGFIFQFYNLMPVLSAFENVELPLLLTNLSRRERKERVEMTLNMVNLADRMDHMPSELSGGQQQRVAIARAIVTDPTLIVADEPTGDLDRTAAADVLALMQRLNQELGKTIIHLDKGELSAASAED